MKEFIKLEERDMYIRREDLISKAATTLFVEAATRNEYGTWEMLDLRLAEMLDVDSSIIDDLAYEIVNRVYELYGKVVANVEVNEYKEKYLMFDITLYGIGIPQYAIEDVCLVEEPYED